MHHLRPRPSQPGRTMRTMGILQTHTTLPTRRDVVNSITAKMSIPDAEALEITPRLTKITSMAPVLLGCHDPQQETTRPINHRLSRLPPLPKTRYTSIRESTERGTSPVTAAPTLNTSPMSHLDVLALTEFPRSHPGMMTMAMEPRLEAETDHRRLATMKIRTTEQLAVASDRVYPPRHAHGTQSMRTTTACPLDAQPR